MLLLSDAQIDAVVDLIFGPRKCPVCRRYWVCCKEACDLVSLFDSAKAAGSAYEARSRAHRGLGLHLVPVLLHERPSEFSSFPIRKQHSDQRCGVLIPHSASDGIVEGSF